ncbi:MAG TPA: FIST N-terminal domain-containing protein [Myxococcota bacterium]|nr:FIST N-terminal domain-containing protein [Myxococcota bacterium]
MSSVCAVAASVRADTRSAVEQLRADLPGSWSAVFVFHGTAHDSAVLAEAVAEAFVGSVTLGCTTMGEVGPLGLTSGGLCAFALGAQARLAVEVVEDTPGFVFSEGEALMEKLSAALGLQREELSAGRHLLLTLTDGLSGAEERVVAALSLSAPGLSLVGGSAGDDLRMGGTTVFLDGRAWPSATLVALIEPSVAFHPFAVHHFRPGQRRVVVTRADPDARVVHELDGWPAEHIYEDLAGLDRGALASEPMLPSAGSICFGIRVADTFFMRSPFCGSDGSLVMRGAVADGDVLQVMHGQDLVEDTRARMSRELAELDEPAGALLFNCGGRLLAARARGLEAELADAMLFLPAAGFSTYGEQFGPLLVNHTLAGVVFGSA